MAVRLTEKERVRLSDHRELITYQGTGDDGVRVFLWEMAESDVWDEVYTIPGLEAKRLLSPSPREKGGARS